MMQQELHSVAEQKQQPKRQSLAPASASKGPSRPASAVGNRTPMPKSLSNPRALQERHSIAVISRYGKGMCCIACHMLQGTQHMMQGLEYPDSGFLEYVKGVAASAGTSAGIQVASSNMQTKQIYRSTGRCCRVWLQSL